MFPKSKSSMNITASDHKSREKLMGCVYEYLKHLGANRAAEAFVNEVQMDPSSIQPSEPPGFLASWWCVFWDLYNAAPERRMANTDHTMEARTFQDIMNPGYGPMHIQSGMPPGSVGDGGFYPNQMRPPLPQSQGVMGAMPPMTGLPPQNQQQQVLMGGPRFQTRPGMRLEMPPGQQQNMNPAIHRLSPGAARIQPGQGGPPPNAAVPFAMRPGMPPQGSNIPPHGQQPRPWPPVSGVNTGPGPSAYSTPPPNSVPAGYPLTPSNSIAQPNTMNVPGVLSSPVQEKPPQNGSEMFQANGSQMGMQRMPPGQGSSNYMPGQNIDNIVPQQAPTPLQRGPQTPQGGGNNGPPTNGNTEQQQVQMPQMINGSGANGSAEAAGLDAMKQASQQPNAQKNGVPMQDPSGQNNGQHEVMGNPGSGAPFNMFGQEEESEAILKYKQSLQDDVRRFEISSTRNQLTPGSSGPGSVQGQQPSNPGLANGTNNGGLERPLSTGGVNGEAPQQPQSVGPGSGPQISDYLFTS